MLGLIAGTFVLTLALLILPAEAVKAYKTNQEKTAIEQNKTTQP